MTRSRLSRRIPLMGAAALALTAFAAGSLAGDEHADGHADAPLRLAEGPAADGALDGDDPRAAVSEILGSGRLGLTADAMIEALGSNADTDTAPETEVAAPAVPEAAPEGAASQVAQDSPPAPRPAEDALPAGAEGAAPVADAGPAWPDTIPPLSDIESVASLSLSDETPTDGSSRSGPATADRGPAPTAPPRDPETAQVTGPVISTPWMTGVYR